jgi:hypothetical protein
MDRNIRPASEDPLGDPADQEIRPASEDPRGDPADTFAGQNIRPASEDPLGDPADQMTPESLQNAVNQHLAGTEPWQTEQNVARQMGGMDPAQANGLAGTLLQAAQQSGVDVGGLLSQLGINPSQAGSALSQITGYLHQNNPEVLSQAASQEPGLAGLIAHPSVGGLLGALASRFLGGR